MHQTFIQSHLLNWLECISLAQASQPTLISSIYAAGTEILFTLDILRQIQIQSSSTIASALSTNLQMLLSNHPSQVLSSLPRLFASFVHSIQKHRGTLFNQPSGSTMGVSNTATDVRKMAMVFLVSCMGLVDQTDDSDGDKVWETRISLLEIVCQETLFNSMGVHLGDEVEAVFRRNGDAAIEALNLVSQGLFSP